MPNRLFGNCVARLGVPRGSLHIIFVILIISLSSFLMSGMEYGTAWKLYATPGLRTVFTIFIFCLSVAGDFCSC